MTASKMSGRPIAKPDADDRIKAEEAVKLRCAGMQYWQIAERMGYRDESGPRKAVDRLLSRVDCEQAAQLRELEGRRLDQLQQAHWVAALQGNVDAARICLQIIDRRAKLFGLNAPARIALDQGLSDVQFANELSSLIDSLGISGLAEALDALPRGRGYGHEIVDAEVIADVDAESTDTTMAEESELPATDPQVPNDGHPLRVAPVASTEDGSAPRRKWSNI